MSLVDTYLEGLRARLNAEGGAALALASGASPARLDALRARWPRCPASLLELLGRIDGTYHRSYGDTRIGVMMLGSDVGAGSYPYYLLSTDDMLAESTSRFANESIVDIYGEDALASGELVDPRIDATLPMQHRLCFSHCMNNGGTSQLHIDFDPAAGGRDGQIVRFLHDPDSHAVIADSFDAYLQWLIDADYPFLFDQDELELHWQSPADRD